MQCTNILEQLSGLQHTKNTHMNLATFLSKSYTSTCLINSSVHMNASSSIYTLLSRDIFSNISQQCCTFSYWDPSIDQQVMSDRVGLNLLYMQTVQDVERGWVLTNHEIQRQLAALQAKGAKKEVVFVLMPSLPLAYSSVILHQGSLF